MINNHKLHLKSHKKNIKTNNYSNRIIAAIIIGFSGALYISDIPQNILGWAFPVRQSTTEIQNLIIGGVQSMDTLTTAGVTNKTTIKVSQY